MLQEISNPIIKTKHLKVWVYRLDLVHSSIGGNKYFKLKYNLEEAKKQEKSRLLTFGGAYSNHIFATASAGQLYSLDTIGMIRGEEHLPLNPILKHAKQSGMQLFYLSRTQYRHKHNPAFIQELQDRFGDFYTIPEGGTNTLALEGCAEIKDEIDVDWDFICTPCGTGGTLAGLALGLSEHQKALGFAVLKAGGFLYQDIQQLIKAYSKQTPLSYTPKEKIDYEIFLNYHFGGYAKTKPELRSFIQDFQKNYGIPIEWVYSGKMFYGLFDLIAKDYFPKNGRIVALHTGGVY